MVLPYGFDQERENFIHANYERLLVDMDIAIATYAQKITQNPSLECKPEFISEIRALEAKINEIARTTLDLKTVPQSDLSLEAMVEEIEKIKKLTKKAYDIFRDKSGN